MDFSTVKIEQIQALIVAFLCWAWFFALAPWRSIKTGVAVDDVPLILRMKPFKILSFMMLIVFLAVAWVIPFPMRLQDVPWGAFVADFAGGAHMPGLGAIVVLWVLLWVWPGLTAKSRMKNDDPPGEWMTPMLTFFRWTWLGIVLLAISGFWQQLPLVEDLLSNPMTMPQALILAVAGPVFFILWWGLPSMKIAQRVSDDDAAAASVLTIVRWYGLPAWFKFVLTNRAPKGSKEDHSHKLCPSCMRPIDNPEKYDTLQFDACPFCKELIPPAVRLEDYITHYADKAQNTISGKRSGVMKNDKQQSDMIQRLVRSILTLGVRERGTDLHFLGENSRLAVRCRTDGVLFTMVDLPEELQRPMISSIKVQCNMDISERRKPQDGSFKTIVDNVKLDVRVNTSPVDGGETASLRLLYRQKVLGSLERLGFGKRNMRIATDAINKPHGLILVTGPTGSGKSTTLYNALAAIADGQRNIITLEDPIEYKMDGLTQMQVDNSKDFSFASGLRSILRQDPDVIMVGEVRDSETAKMAIDAAMTGHLVLSSLHTIDTFTAIGRLSDLGVDAHRHAEAVLLIIAQRLVRINCDKCSQEYAISGDELASLGIPDGPETFIAKRGEGCPRCHESGYYDREGIYELFYPDGITRELISNRASVSEIRRTLRAGGMRTLLEDGLTKVILGRTTVDEVLRVTS